MLKMEINGGTSAATPTVSAVAVATVKETTTPINSPSPTSSPPPPPLSPQQTVVLSPCAACKILRRRCAEKCVLAPYFPPTDPAKFTIAHRVFGASNIIKFLQELPESQRTDAVNSMVYEAGARMRDPVYGCAGAIYHLQRQVSELQAQLVKTQVELVSMQLQRSDLLELLYKMEQTKLAAQEQGQQNMSFEMTNDLGFLEDNNNNNSSMSWWDPLWT
ncbi:BnaA04g28360D [Brassica napus]|uniref:BnaA04g28360D protein n=1 Tax=Brassica napus TaxID=3708 RepID=A0A078JDD1_BRANA|nr:BnaA04g28360D [Brassica napus]